MKIEVNFEKKHLVILSFLLSILVLSIAVAYGTNNPNNFGHSAGELDGVCRSDGTGCPIFSSNTPDFESDWITLSNGVTQSINHNLGTNEFSKFQAVFRRPIGLEYTYAYSDSMITDSVGFVSGGSYNYGIEFHTSSLNTVNYSTGVNGVLYMALGRYYNHQGDVQVKVKIWK